MSSRQRGQQQSQTPVILAPLKVNGGFNGKMSPIKSIERSIDEERRKFGTSMALGNQSPQNNDLNSSRNMVNSFIQSPKTTKPLSLTRGGLLEPIPDTETGSMLNSKRQQLIKKLIIQYSNKFGTQQETLAVIQKAIVKKLEGRDVIKAHIFDEIEMEIQNQVKGVSNASSSIDQKLYQSADNSKSKSNLIKLNPIKLTSSSPHASYQYESKTPHPISLQKNIDKVAINNDYGNHSAYTARAKSVTRVPEARKEYTKQMVDAQLNDLIGSTKHPGPYYKNSQYEHDERDSTQSIMGKNGRKHQNKPLIISRDPKETELRIKQIKEKLSSIISQANSSEGITQMSSSISQTGAFSSNSNAIFEKVLKKHFIDKNITPTSAEHISNEDLWKILTHYQIEKGHHLQQEEKDKHKQKYQAYHITLKDQLQLNAHNRTQSHDARLNEKKTYRAYHEQLKNQILYEEVLNEQERKQALQNRIMEMKEHQILRKAHKLIDQGVSTDIAKNGNQYLKLRDEEHKALKQRTKEQRLNDNEHNLTLLNRQSVLEKAQRQEIIRQMNQEESFLDRLILKKEAKKAELANGWDLKHMRAVVAGTQMKDEDGNLQFIVRKSRLEKLQEDEIRARFETEMQLKAKDEAEKAQKERDEKRKQEIYEHVMEKAKKKYHISKLQQYNSRIIDFTINKDTELYGTLKLPLLQEHVEADQQGIGEKGLIKRKQASFKEALNEMQKFKKDPTPNQVNDIELLYNKDVFEEIGLL